MWGGSPLSRVVEFRVAQAARLELLIIKYRARFEMLKFSININWML
jgi:hypothetical protein